MQIHRLTLEAADAAEATSSRPIPQNHPSASTSQHGNSSIVPWAFHNLPTRVTSRTFIPVVPSVPAVVHPGWIPKTVLTKSPDKLCVAVVGRFSAPSGPDFGQAANVWVKFDLLPSK